MEHRKWLAVSVAFNVIGVGVALWGVAKLGGWRFTAHRLHTIQSWPGVTQRQSQLELLPIDSGAVVMLGDSHVSHGEWASWLPTRSLLNRGISSTAVAHVAAFAKTIPLQNASAIVLQLGTNDLLFLDAARALDGYQDFVEELQARTGVEAIVLCTVPGVNNDVRWTGIDSDAAAAFNVGLRELARARGWRLCDVARALGSEGGQLPAHLTDDGVHLRGEGYRLWAEALAGDLPRGTMLGD